MPPPSHTQHRFPTRCVPSPALQQVALSLALGESLAHRLRCRLFDALLHRDPLFFDSVKTGQMVAWLGQDIEVLQVRLGSEGRPSGGSKLLGNTAVLAA